jgi:hypothetical protein
VWCLSCCFPAIVAILYGVHSASRVQLRSYLMKSSGSCLENREYGRRDPSRWPRGTLYPQKLALTSPTRGGRSVGIVRSRTQTVELIFFFSSYLIDWASHIYGLLRTRVFVLWYDNARNRMHIPTINITRKLCIHSWPYTNSGSVVWMTKVSIIFIQWLCFYRRCLEVQVL